MLKSNQELTRKHNVNLGVGEGVSLALFVHIWSFHTYFLAFTF